MILPYPKMYSALATYLMGLPGWNSGAAGVRFALQTFHDTLFADPNMAAMLFSHTRKLLFSDVDGQDLYAVRMLELALRSPFLSSKLPIDVVERFLFRSASLSLSGLATQRETAAMCFLRVMGYGPALLQVDGHIPYVCNVLVVSRQPPNICLAFSTIAALLKSRSPCAGIDSAVVRELQL